MVAREIAESFLTAGSPLEVYRLALARVTPLVGASFASVFLRDPAEPRLLRLACAQNWPQSSARFLAELRIREGRGPTGRAVARRRPVVVPDVFGDESLREWWDAARELGFVSTIALPLVAGERVLGSLSFYFRERQQFDDDARTLLGVVAHQLATTADRAHQIDDLRSRNLRLERENEALLKQIADAESMIERVRHEGRTSLTDRAGPAAGSR